MQTFSALFDEQIDFYIKQFIAGRKSMGTLWDVSLFKTFLKDLKNIHRKLWMANYFTDKAWMNYINY